ncbi:MAG: undecaprenyl/decaprenyl-phosphate alpha-N-acetylglucosaminyl 1-phosphate transferase [Desulfocapsa sp.]|nr:undecaprenyl/decaprenyl-phosphate alpha-N-acetylglucosaminyl 1-phosphate transferase [Desulfocapsa sp.]
MTSNSLLLHILFFLLLTSVAYCVTWFFYRTAIATDQPNERSSHLHTTPRSGGVAIVVTFLIGMLLIYYFGDKTHIQQIYMVSFLVSSLFVALISFLDDLKTIRSVLKLAVMIIAILIAMWGGILLDQLFIPGIGYVHLGWLAYPLTLFWILGLTNAVNFMDGLDGLIGGTAAIVALFFMIITFSQGSTFVYITSYTILAGSIGFLFFNFPPAKIFMGDVGSVFLGFVFAILAIIATRYDHSHTSFLVMPLLLFHVIFDTFFTFLRRCIRGENVMEAHRSHLYQLVQQMGYSHLKVSLMQYCFCFLQGLGALWMVQVQGNQRLSVFLPFFLLQAVYALVVIKTAKSRGLL